MMDWQDALGILSDHPHINVYQQLCREENPDRIQRDGYRGVVVRMVTRQGQSPSTVVVSPGGSIQPIDDFTSLASSAAPAANKTGGGCGCGGPQPVPQPRSPNLVTQAVTAARAGLRWAAGGFRFAPPEVQANRRTICDACEHHETRQDQCNICKCFLKQKIKLPQEACPISKWVAISSDPSSVSPALPFIPPP